MPAIKVVDNVYWVGAVDWTIRSFHGPSFHTPYGTTYNSYLVMDDKITLVDGVYKPFTEELVRNIKEVVDPAVIEVVVVNHVEPDHSGAIPAIMELAPQAKVVCSRQGKAALEKHYNTSGWDFLVVKTGDCLCIGENTLQFIEAPMLHWPDSMFTYIENMQLLMPNDAFGQHLATSERFVDEVDNALVMREAAKYYANILLPFSDLIVKKISELGKMGLKISTIAPSHGLIWRRNPAQIINAYLDWASGVGRSKAVIIYDTMWGSTEKMAYEILNALVGEGYSVKLHKAAVADRNVVMTDIMEAGLVLFGSSTINNGFLPTMAPILDELKGLKPKRKMTACFGSQGWAGGAIKHMEQALEEAGMPVGFKAVSVKWVPTAEELQLCRELGAQAAQAMQEESQNSN
jgi:flavorubredoxin